MIDGYVIAVQLDALARWVDDELAGGVPPKWVAKQAAAGCRYVAAECKAAELSGPCCGEFPCTCPRRCRCTCPPCDCW